MAGELDGSAKKPFSTHCRSEEATAEELTLDQLEKVRGGDNQNQADELLGLSSPVPRDSQFYGDWSNGRQLALDGAKITAEGMTLMWGAAYATPVAPVVTPFALAGGASAAWVGTERIEEGAQQMRDAEAKYDAHRADQLRQVAEAEARELKELEEAKERQEAQEREDNRLLEESDRMLREDWSPSTAQGGPAANSETYSGELPAFPGQIVNAAPRETEIRIEPIGFATVGYGDSNQQESRPGRLY